MGPSRVVRVLVFPALTAALLLFIHFFRAPRSVHPDIGDERPPPPSGECIRVEFTVTDKLQDNRAKGVYRKQAWTVGGTHRPIYSKVDPLVPYYVYKAVSGGWIMTASLNDFKQDAGFFHSDFSALGQSPEPWNVGGEWQWGDGMKWHSVQDMSLVPWGCPQGPRGLLPPPTVLQSSGKLQRQYTAVFQDAGANTVGAEGWVDKDAPGGGFNGKMKWKVLSAARPRLVYVSNFSDDADCEAILIHARQSLERSSVVASSPRDAISSVRTSFGMFLNAHQMAEPRIDAMRRRVARIAQLPLENVEATQVLRYEPGQFYGPHPDFFDRGSEHLARGGQRVASALSWLNDVKGGGVTKFPKQPGLKVAPKKGDMILFFNTLADGTIDEFSEHQALPPEKGAEKWVQVHWIRQEKFI
eukprot:Hpha_TRINITY_DN23138_c0_g1::TRINITY_DN23138_c0_g1_i1::g.29461::m.29461/K00472/P4HA; prolyl 4-hydroxylase